MFRLFTDGGSRGNPGRSAIGGVLVNGESVVFEYSQLISDGTNNIAEYKSLIFALKKLISEGVREAEHISDSLLMVNQINGKFKVSNPQLRLLFSEVASLKKLVNVIHKWNAREGEWSKYADRLVNRALDSN